MENPTFSKLFSNPENCTIVYVKNNQSKAKRSGIYEECIISLC
jgi:hypothetical protein